MGSGIQKIEVNQNWFYHRIKEEEFDKIILSGGLKSKRKIGTQERYCASFNGNDFILLTKKWIYQGVPLPLILIILIGIILILTMRMLLMG